MKNIPRNSPLGLVVPLLLAGCSGAPAERAQFADDYEVWVVDQSDSSGQSYGGTLYVFDAAALDVQDAASAQPYDRVDLAGATSTVCMERTGANPVRPHMLLFNDSYSHAILSFVASGHVVIMDASTREPLDCFRSTQSPTGQQAHAAFPSPDGSYVIVANQSGKRLERIDTNFETNSFTYRTDATLDLATCTTPSGAPCESADLRPLNWPICPIIDDEGRHVFVTLRGGGMLVVDPRQTPMAILGEYDRATVHGNGCGGVQVGDHMYVNSGGSPVNVSQESLDHPALYGFDVYRFPLAAYAAGNPANTPAPEVVFTKSGAADSHGMVATADGAHIWVFDRHAGVAEVLATQTGQRVNTISLVGSLSAEPAPDLADISPAGDLLFVALRGPTPLSGDPHNARGSTPGLGIIHLESDGRSGEFRSIVPVTNVDADGVERADVHSVRVRRRPA
jgi:DNA-binding beta-propeller fold protein YncE